MVAWPSLLAASAHVLAHQGVGPMAGCGCGAYLPEPADAPFYASMLPQEQPDSKLVGDSEQEPHLRNVTQLTFGGQNAEAYWNIEGTKVTYQSRQPGYPDEQIFSMNPDGSKKTLISTGKGRCTCSYFSPDGKFIYFSSTHELNEGAQEPVDMSKGYVWKVNPQFALYRRELATGDLELVLRRDGYVAETTISPDGSYMTFTGSFDGDLDIYRSDLDGTGIKRLTDAFGYDGGPFVSWDGKTIVYRRSAPKTDQEAEDYRNLLRENLVRPGNLDLWVMDADGSNKRQVTDLEGAAFAPFLHPNNRQIIFSSNHHDPRGREFDLFVVNVDGTGLKQITFTPEFDGFPMFSRDGKKLLWASNRFGAVRGETNVFVADWVDGAETTLIPTDDIWVYSFGADPREDQYLRCWGGWGASTEEGEDSYSILRFDISALPEKAPSSAKLVLTHIATDAATASAFKDLPLQVRPVTPGFDEDAWKPIDGLSFYPKKDVLGIANTPPANAESPFMVEVVLSGEALAAWWAECKAGGALGLGLTAAIMPSGRDAGYYKFYSRQGPEGYRPKLVLSFD